MRRASAGNYFADVLDHLARALHAPRQEHSSSASVTSPPPPTAAVDLVLYCFGYAQRKDIGFDSGAVGVLTTLPLVSMM